MVKTNSSVSLDQELWTWLSDKDFIGGSSGYINKVLLDIKRSEEGVATKEFLQEKINDCDLDMETLLKKRNSYVKQLLTLTEKEFEERRQREQEEKDKLEQQLNADKEKKSKIKNFFKKIIGIQAVVKEYESNPDVLEDHWILKNQMELYNKNYAKTKTDIPGSYLRTFLEDEIYKGMKLK
jgi:hypothetical protein